MTADSITRFDLLGANSKPVDADTDGSADCVFDLLYTDPRPVITTGLDSLDAASEIADSSKKRIDAPVRKTFVRAEGEASPPLANLYAGGRSGIVAVKLYLALIWRSGGSGYASDKPARAWATLLDLPDPEALGARRIKAAMKALAQQRLLTITPQPGGPNLITLLDEGGTGRPYELPSSAYSRAQARGAGTSRLRSNLYFKVPTRLWTEGYIQTMTGPGLVMLLILLAEQGGTGQQLWISPAAFADRYKISRSTRTAGTKELKRLRLLVVERESLSARSTQSVFDERRRRNVYRLAPRAQETSKNDQRPSSKTRS